MTIPPRRSLTERIFHALTFELIALLICGPLFGWLMDTSVAAMGSLTLAISGVAMTWNVVYNALFDRAQRRMGFTRTLAVRILHAIGFELGLLLASVPLAAVWLNISLWPAFVLDLGLVLFFLPYTVVFNAAYDALRARWFTRPAS
jgi:uncharacterized membrane protein